MFIYCLKDPDTNEIRYIGKTNNLKQRFHNHKNKITGTHCSNWILKLKANGKVPIMELVEECSNDIWQEREIYWIAQYPNLTNHTIGGDGCLGATHSLETRQKMSLSRAGKSTYWSKNPLSDEHKNKISISMKARDSFNFKDGYKHSSQTIEKFKGRKCNAKLTLEDVVKIKNSTDTLKVLSLKYSVSISTIHNIKTGKSWSDIDAN